MVWFIGNKFMDRSFTEHFRHFRNADKEPNFTIQNFEVYDYSSTKYSSSIRGIIPRILSLMAKGITENKYLPATLVYVMDDNIIKQLGFNYPVKFKQLEIMLKYLVEELHRMLTRYKEKLPVKAKKLYHPQVI